MMFGRYGERTGDIETTYVRFLHRNLKAEYQSTAVLIYRPNVAVEASLHPANFLLVVSEGKRGFLDL